MKASQLIARGTEILDEIAGNTPLMGFDWFNVDMTEAKVLRDVDGKLAMVNAMERASGQKTSERMLWGYTPVAREKANEIAARERQARLDAHAASYAADPSFEVEVDTVAFATGLAKKYWEEFGEAPLFLLDENGEY